MAQIVALVVLLVALVALVSGQYLASPYARAGFGYAGAPLLARGAYAPFGGLGYAHAGYPGYLGYGARGVVLG